MRHRRPWIRVTIDSVNHSGTVSGHKAKELIEACGGRPMWSRRRNAWCTSESVATDVLAMAEVDGFAVQFTQVGGGLNGIA